MSGQLLERLTGAFGVGEAEGRQARLCHLGGQRLASARPDERVEQRAEEDPLVDRAHGGLVAAKLVVELLEGAHIARVAIAHDAGDARACAFVGGQGVHLLLVDELQPMLHRSEELVGVFERAAVVWLDVPAAGELGQSIERCR